jgi:hypothetical protein
MADSEESILSPASAQQSGTLRKRRASPVSTETENKLARAARSAQRLAQLSDAAHGGFTLDLFPDDIARAEQQALNTDVRQGTLQGFELPDVVLAAASAPDRLGFSASAATARGARAGGAKSDAGAVNPHDGQLSIDTEVLEHAPPADNAPATPAAADTPPQSAPLIAASVARNSAALRSPVDGVDGVDHAAEPVSGLSVSSVDAASATPPGQARPTAAQFAPSKAPMPRATPELDHARATAFADTVDALYGVIADQRRAAGEHSRRMKWLLSIVVCALLATIVIGVAQTLLLFRLAHQSTAHEQRIEQMLLNQQATLATLFDTDSSTMSLPARPQAPAPAPDPAVTPAVAVTPAKTTQTSAVHSHRGHQRKLAHANK